MITMVDTDLKQCPLQFQQAMKVESDISVTTIVTKAVVSPTATGTSYTYGLIPSGSSNDGFAVCTQSQWGLSCSSNSLEDGMIWSNAVPSSITLLVNTIPNGGILPAGSYTLSQYDSFGDSSDGDYVALQYQEPGGSWALDPNVVNHAQSGAVWSSYGWSNRLG